MQLTTRSIICSFLLFLGTGSIPVHAATASPSASPQDDVRVNQNIIDRVKQQVDEKVKGTTTNAKTVFGFIGTLEKTVSTSLQVRTYEEKLRVIELDKDATLLKDAKAIPWADVELNSPVLVMGFFDPSSGVYQGRRLIVLGTAVTTPNQTSLAATFSTSTTKALTVNQTTNGQTSETKIPITSKTQYFNRVSAVIKRTELRSGDKLVVIEAENATASSSALRVYSLTTEPQATTTP